MFMTDHELIYGKSAGQSGAYTNPVYAEENKENEKHSSEFMKKTGAATVAAAKFTGKAAVGAAKTASNAATKFTKNAAEYLKSDDAAEKMNFLKSKAKSAASDAGSILSGIKNKASDKISERKNKVNSSDENIPPTDEYVAEENYDVSSDETVYQNDEESAYEAPDSIADDVTDKNESPLTESDNTAQSKETTSVTHQNNNTSFPYNTQNQNYQQPQSPVPPQSSAPGYIIQKQKTNPVLIIVIVVLVLVIGVLCGMFFMMSRNDKSDDSSNSTPVSDVEKTTDSEEAPTESKTNTTTVEETTTAETTTAATTIATPEKDSKTLTTYPESDISKYPQYIKAAENDRDSGLADYFALVDINADNIPELFLTDMDGRIYAIYTAVGNDYAELQRVGGTGRDWITLYNDGCISHGSSFGNNGGYTDYEYIGGKELKEIKSYSLEEYNDIPASHGGEANISVSSLANYVSKEPTISAYIEGKSYYPIGDGIDFILHTNGDYSYYHYEGYETGGGEYDNKCASGDTSESAVRITAGSSISYVKVVITPYNANGAAGETITVDYTVTPSQNSVEVYSCNALGQINAPGGGPINGYATSYIVDRGAVSYTRTDLMDNWHVTAVRYCIVSGITWFELYDTDDGDYYGWVDEDHIDFY